MDFVTKENSRFIITAIGLLFRFIRKSWLQWWIETPALKYIKDHGITTQTAYPYKGVTELCKKQGGQFKIIAITEDSGCSGIQNALSGRPIAVAVDAGGWSHYASGVFSNCGKNINHVVLLVGVVIGSWKIKNSWGTSWGQKGFIRLASGDTCGICQQPGVYPH